jgi:ATPase subunit of ABC transporter with duplicated ATPase domains
MRKMAKKLKEDAEVLEAGKISVRKNDKELKSFVIPYQSQDTSSRGVGIDLLTINSITLPTGQLIDLARRPISVSKGKKIQLKGPNGIGKCIEYFAWRLRC